MTLVTLFIDNPLLNEPGFTEKSQYCKPYRDILEYMNFKTAIHGMITRKLLPDNFLGFYPIMKSHILEKKHSILQRLEKLANSDINDSIPRVNIYNMETQLDYKKIRDKLNITIENI